MAYKYSPIPAPQKKQAHNMQQNELLYVEKEIANKRATFWNSRACPSGYIDSGVGFPGHVKNVSSISRVVEIKARITGRDGCNGECTSIFFYVSTSDPLGTVGMPKHAPPRAHLYDFWSNDFCSVLDPESAEKMEVVGSFCSFSNSPLTTISMSVYPDGLTVKDMEMRGCFLLLPCQQTKKVICQVWLLNLPNYWLDLWPTQVMFFIPPGAIQAPHFLREESVESVSVGYGYMEVLCPSEASCIIHVVNSHVSNR